MNYELAKELKDAGFPQIADGRKCVCPNNKHFGRDCATEPTLSELIESFDTDFYSLERIGPTCWRAQSFATKEETLKGRLIGHRADAAFPDVALARLWLIVYANGSASAELTHV
jgi:hypothetical protein